jgi:hypothetical protein
MIPDSSSANDRDDLDEEPAERAARVDRLVDGREVDVLPLHHPLRLEEVEQVPIQAIELRDDDGRDPRRDGVDDQAVPDRRQQVPESGAVRRPPGKPVVDELADERVSLRGAVRPDAGSLRLDREPLPCLVFCAHPQVGHGRYRFRIVVRSWAADSDRRSIGKCAGHLIDAGGVANCL